MSQALRVPPGPGCAIESATSHVEILVCDAAGEPRAHQAEEVGFGHARRLAPLFAVVFERAKTAARDLT